MAYRNPKGLYPRGVYFLFKEKCEGGTKSSQQKKDWLLQG